MSKVMKKIERKIRKHQHTVSKETGVICTNFPTKNLAICNVGIVNGISEEIIIENFSKYGPLDAILLLPEKSCSFITYRSLNSAIKAYDEANGCLNIAQDNKVVYLSYVENIPNAYYKKSYDMLPPGLILLKDFVNEEEENLLLQSQDSSKSCTQGIMKHRQVKHYGYEFCYDINNVKKDEPLEESIPEQYRFASERLKERCKKFETFFPDQLTINHYSPGQGIPHHVDTHSAFEDPIISLSLGSSIIMDFKHEDGRHICVLLPRRSLLVMSEESRYNWTHGIVPKKFDVVLSESGYNILQRGTRISFTFRKVRKGHCTCPYKSKCDSFKSKMTEKNLENNVAKRLEEIHVHKVYEEIASHFSDTRHKPWPNVLAFIERFDIGSVLADVGCGNGKYLGQTRSIYSVGCDRSPSLINVCKERSFEVFICDSLNIPLRDNSVDGAISIAVIHHMANHERRLQAVSEIIRVLRISGEALIYVWAKTQVRDEQKTAYIKQDRKNRKPTAEIISESTESVTVMDDVTLPLHKNRTFFQHKDLLVPWKIKGVHQKAENEETFLRYYHVFEEGELENLCKMNDSVDIVHSYYDEGNWCVIIKKIK